jgi:predicted nucleotidyltransferase
MDWLKDIEQYIIFEAMTGSQMYGTADKHSDEDRRGVCIPPLDIQLGILGNFEQKDGWEGEFEDRVIYNIRKFFETLLKNNPTILEFLFIPEANVIKTSPYWKRIVDNRDIFISKKVRHTFAGYAHSQLGRIKRHRAYLLNPPDHKPTREEFGLPPNPSIAYEHLSAILTLPLEYIRDEIKEMAQNEARYRTFKQEWDDYADWEKGRNERRAELEKKWGYDTKHASHLYRLMEEGKECLITGKITLPRPEKEVLVAIKWGAYKYDQLIEMVDNFDAEFEKLYEESKLPFAPDRKKANDLYLEILDAWDDRP